MQTAPLRSAQDDVAASTRLELGQRPKAQHLHRHGCEDHHEPFQVARGLQATLLEGRQRDASTYAELGLWYDALESLSEAIEADRDDLELLELRDSLLRQAELDAALK